MNANMNDIAGFDAMTEEVRYVYAERDRLRDEVEALRQFKTDICEVLGIGGNSHNDGIVKLLKANKARTSLDADDNRMYRDILDEIKKYFKMTAPHWKYSDIPHFVKTAHEFALEKKEDAEEQAKQFAEDICAALGIRPDMRTKKSVLGEISKLRREHDGSEYSLRKQEEFTEEAASILGVHPGDLSLSDILEALRKLKRYEELNNMNCEIIAYLKTERDKLQQDYLNEIGRRKIAERYLSDSLSKICSALGIEYSTDTTLEYILDTIDDPRGKKSGYSYSQSFVFNSVCTYLGITADNATLSDIRTEIEKLKSWKTVAEDRDKRRRNWVRKYKSEHERANSCDELYKKYKALYDADAPARKKLSDDIETYKNSYVSIKNVATKNRSLMNTVAQIVGTVGMHDDVTMAAVQNDKKKANHWDILVDSYGEGTMRSLLDNIGIDVSGDKGNGLFR